MSPARFVFLEVLSLTIMHKASKFFSSIIYMKEVSEGYNAKVRRLFPIGKMDQLDPFLLFDLFSGKLPGGFPDHPHRGMETVTYLLQGKTLHEDFKGHKGTLTAGAVQWMTAGKGIVHSEIPASDKEDSVGYQLWINLPKDKKMVEPRYQEFAKEQIPEHDEPGVKIKVIAGKFKNTNGGVALNLPINYYVYELEEGASSEYIFPPGWNGFFVVSHGEIQAGEDHIKEHHGAILHPTKEEVKIPLKAVKKSTFSVITGKPLNEPMARAGPFVMNTHEEIEQAYRDYSLAQNGFEHRKGWRSENSKLIKDFDAEDD